MAIQIACTMSGPASLLLQIGAHLMTYSTRAAFALMLCMTAAHGLYAQSSSSTAQSGPTPQAKQPQASEKDSSAWVYKPELLQPFWIGDKVFGESVLFIRDKESGRASAKVLYPFATSRTCAVQPAISPSKRARISRSLPVRGKSFCQRARVFLRSCQATCAAQPSRSL